MYFTTFDLSTTMFHYNMKICYVIAIGARHCLSHWCALFLSSKQTNLLQFLQMPMYSLIRSFLYFSNMFMFMMTLWSGILQDLAGMRGDYTLCRGLSCSVLTSWRVGRGMFWSKNKRHFLILQELTYLRDLSYISRTTPWSIPCSSRRFICGKHCISNQLVARVLCPIIILHMC